MGGMMMSGAMQKSMLILMVAALAASAEPGGMDGNGGPGMGGHGKGGMPGMGPGGLEFLHPKMLKELGLSEDQQKKLREQQLAFQKKRIQIQSEKSILELDLQNVFATVPVKEAEALKIGEKIADVERKALLLRVEGMGKFLAGLTPEQHRKVMEYQADLREKRKTWREEMDRGMKRRNREGAPHTEGGKH